MATMKNIDYLDDHIICIAGITYNYELRLHILKFKIIYLLNTKFKPYWITWGTFGKILSSNLSINVSTIYSKIVIDKNNKDKNDPRRHSSVSIICD